MDRGIEEVRDKLEKLERERRRNNIIITGLKEDTGREK